MSAVDSSYAAFLGHWHALNKLMASRGLPEIGVEEATRLHREAQDEAARITFRHLKRAYCAGTCPHEVVEEARP